MALFICPNCGNMISDKAPVCPKCGLANPHSHISDSSSAPNTPPLPPQPYNTSSADVPAEHSPLPYPEDNGYTPYSNDNFNSSNNNGNNNRSNRALWIVIIILLIAAAGIGTYYYIDNKNQQKREETERREQHRRDSIAAEEARAEALARLAALEKQRLDSIEWYSFTSPDLTLLDLHGHVKSVSYTGDVNLTLINYFSNNFNINEDGNITNLTITRNNQGQITTIKKRSDYMPDYYEQISIKWSGNTPKTLSGNGIDWASDEMLTYSNGSLVSTSSESGAEGYYFSSTSTVSPLEFDNYGNWTVANITHNEVVDGSDHGEDIETNSSSYTIRRNITYYPL